MHQIQKFQASVSKGKGDKETRFNKLLLRIMSSFTHMVYYSWNKPLATKERIYWFENSPN